MGSVLCGSAGALLSLLERVSGQGPHSVEARKSRTRGDATASCLTELAESKLSSARELLTVITVGVGSGKFNKLFGKFSIPIVFLQKITELRPQKGFF